MPLESATYIHQLNSANPLGSDPIASGDDHLRLIKAALQATFPNITGPVTSTHTQLNNLFPVGGIIMWSGSVASIPSGWALCNGQNGTPDLRNRFIVGAGDQYAVAATGGADSVTLTESQIPSHTHAGSVATGGAHTHTVTGTTSSAGAHQHIVGIGGGQGSVNLGNNLVGDPGQRQTNDRYTESAGAHTHTVSGTAESAGGHTHTLTINNTGGGTAHENRPPYYALAYIMKV